MTTAEAKPKRRKRRRRSPGVTLMAPDEKSRTWWRARFIDPDTQRTKKVTLDRALTTQALREDYCVRLSERLRQRKIELAQGAKVATHTPVVDAFDRYFTAHRNLRPGTLRTYRSTSDKFLKWAKDRRLRTVDEITRGVVTEFREHLVSEPKRGAVKQAGRGAKGATRELRSPHTINRELRSLRAILGYLCDADLCAKLSHDDLRRSLKRLPAPVDRVEFLKPAAIKRLLEAALRHDAAVFKETRAEHAGVGQPGSTAKFEPIAPFVLGVLLSGMRVGEAVTVDWAEVDLDALDSEGSKAGEIVITSASKTRRGRVIGLAEVSPALRRLLVAQKLRTGGKGPVFQTTLDTANTALQRLRSDFGAPKDVTWQMLRRTCAVFLVNAPGIYGSASIFRSARQLGHSVAVSEKFYLDVLKGIPRDAHDLETAMQIQDEANKVIGSMTGNRARLGRELSGA